MEKLIIFLSLGIFLQFQVYGDGFSEGIESYNKGNYTDAVQHFEEYLTTPGLTVDQRLRAKAYLGASQFILGKESLATGWFLSILNDNYEYKLNPVYFPPEIISFFNEVKLTVSPLVFKKERRHFFLNFLPFGAGQFQNHEYIKGALLAGAEVLALSINLDTYFRRKAIEENGKYPEGRLSEAKRLQNIQLIAGGIFIAGYIYGVIDSSLNYKRGKNLSVSILNSDGVLSLSWRF